MRELSLRQFACFSNSQVLQRLNNLLSSRNAVMPHEVASATGCSLREAMAFLLLLYVNSVAEVALLVYDKHDESDPLVPFVSRDITEGIPSLPIVCDVCGREISEPNDLGYDFLFRIVAPVRFAI